MQRHSTGEISFSPGSVFPGLSLWLRDQSWMFNWWQRPEESVLLEQLVTLQSTVFYQMHGEAVVSSQLPVVIYPRTRCVLTVFYLKKCLWFFYQSCILNWTINSTLLCSRMLFLSSNRTVSSLMRAEIYYPISSFMFPFQSVVLAVS